MTPEPRAEQEIARETVTAVAGVVRALGLYDVNNTAVQRLIDQLLSAWQRNGGGELRVQLLTDEYFVNDRLLRLDAQLYDRCTSLSAALGKLGVGEITLGPGLERSHVEALCSRLAAAVRGQGKLSLDAVGPIALGIAIGSGIAAYRFEPERLAVSAIAGLVSITERLYLEHGAGRVPSLLPIKRSLQMIAEGMDQDPGYYLLLSAIFDPSSASSTMRARVAAAVHAIGFALGAGLGREVMMTSGLAAIVGGLADKGDPDAAVRPLFRFPGLGDSALPLAVALHDARALRLGRAVGLAGQLVALAHAYVERTSAARPGLAPARFVDALAAGELRVVEPRLARAFAAWLGPWPMGSLCRLKDGRLGLVIGLPEKSRDRPILQLLGKGGEPLERVDLAQNRTLEIVETPTYKEAEVNPTRW